MACGTPVVASDISALREVSAGAATLVPPGDEEALATSIAALVEDRQLHAAARERGLQRASAFGWTKTASALWEYGAHAHAPPAAVDQLPAVGARRGRRAAGMAPAGGDAKDWAILATVVYARSLRRRGRRRRSGAHLPGRADRCGRGAPARAERAAVAS